jgi:hypothetical protein
VHDNIEKLYTSVHVIIPNDWDLPPNANAAVFVPAPASPYLPVDKALPLNHEVPLYDSLHEALGEVPPNANAAVCVPAPANLYLACDKAPPADQEVPLYASVQSKHE